MSGFIALGIFLLAGGVLMATGGEWAAMIDMFKMAAVLCVGFILGRMAEREYRQRTR